MSENLISLADRTDSERKEIAKKGGKKSVEIRRKKREIKELLNFIDEQPLPENLHPTEIIKMDNPTIRDGIIATLINKILIGQDMKALELYLKLKGEYPKDIELNNQSLTVIWNEKRYGTDEKAK